MPDTLTTLIIDDSQNDREHYFRSLKKVTGTNYCFLEASDGQKGLEIIEAKPVDCVLLDHYLPGMNGLEMLTRLHARHPFLAVILLTGQGNETIAVEAIKQGAYDYLVKSAVTPEHLHQTIKAAIDQSTLKKRIEEKTHALELAKKEQDRLISKLTESNSELERFAYICSHDLQEPLRMISSFSERLEQHLGDTLDDKGRHYLQYITDGTAQACQLISDVLGYTRVDNATEQLTNIKSEKTLAGVLRDLNNRIEETGAQITHDLLPEVYVQPSHLRHLLQNLIGNALKFCSDKPRVHISAEPEGVMWRFSVRDNGIGIAPEHREKIFHIFQRLHSREHYPGTGIGLALCKKLVRKYDGRIWAESEPGKGSTFYFTLPHAATGENETAQMHKGTLKQ